MPAAKINLALDQGSTFRQPFSLKQGSPAGPPVNLSGCTARSKFRYDYADPTVLADLTTDNGGLTIDGSGGVIHMYITDAQTAALLSNGVYDIEVIYPNGDVNRVVQGRFTVSPEVTYD